MNKQAQLVQYLSLMTQEEFDSWVVSATSEEIDMAYDHYQHLQQKRVEASLAKYEAQARAVIEKAMRK
jgi:hypothetical protein